MEVGTPEPSVLEYPWGMSCVTLGLFSETLGLGGGGPHGPTVPISPPFRPGLPLLVEKGRKLAGVSGHLTLQLLWVRKGVIKSAQPCSGSKS